MYSELCFLFFKISVGISDPSGSLVTVRGLRIVLQDLSQKPPSPAVAKRLLSHVVTANSSSLLLGSDCFYPN